MTAVEGTLVAPLGELHLVAAAAIDAGSVIRFGTTPAVVTSKDSIELGEKYTAYGNVGPTYRLAAASSLTGVESDSVDWDDTANEVVLSGDWTLGRLTTTKLSGETTATVCLNS